MLTRRELEKRGARLAERIWLARDERERDMARIEFKLLESQLRDLDRTERAQARADD